MQEVKIDKYVGKKYNRWTIIEFSYTKNGNKYYKCKCECGKIKNVNIRSIYDNKSKSCGCYKREVDIIKGRKMLTKHNLSNTRLWNIWRGIINRCYCKSSENYYLYGGRGILVCNEWKNDFLIFYNWAINNGYKENLTIERIDVNGNYEPSNCRWATIIEQAYNKRNTIFIYNNDKKYTVNDLSNIYGIDKKKIRDRYYKKLKFEDIIYNGNLRYKV